MPDTSLMDSLVIGEATFLPDWGHQFSRTKGGILLAAEGRPVRWRMRATCSVLSHSQAKAAEAELSALQGSLGTFLAWDPKSKFPIADPKGLILGATVPTIKTLNADNQRLSLQNLPVGYVLTKGDMLSFIYSSTSYALHRIRTASTTANGSGFTAEFEVTPQIKPGAAVSAAVTLIKASAEMRIVPGSVQGGATGPSSTISFEAVQV